jgi:hypothetical protein
MLGGKVKLEIFAPTLNDPTVTPVHASISQKHIEFDDVSFTDLNGDPYEVLPSQIDVKGSHVTYKVIYEYSGYFADVDDKNGFNGYVLTFAELGGSHGMSLRSAQIVGKNTTLDIDKSDVFVSKRALFVNVDGLYFEPKDTLDIKLGFKMHGNRHDNALSGRDGDDLIIGGHGSDTLRGRAGADTFQFASATSHGTISDFDAAQGDRIDLSRLHGDFGRANGQHFSLVGDGGFSGAGNPEIRIRHMAGDLYVVTADRDGDGAADLSLNVYSASALNASDFDF